MLRPQFTAAFKRDRKLAKRRGKDIAKLHVVMGRLANEERLEPTFRDHKLSGEWHDCRACHIEADWLLIYRVADDVITFVRTGRHADLFDE